jgi:hypothetical protein
MGMKSQNYSARRLKEDLSRQLVVKSSVFWDITLCSPLKVSWLAYSSTLKMVTTYSSETSVDFQWTALHYTSSQQLIPSDIYFTRMEYIAFPSPFILQSLSSSWISCTLLIVFVLFPSQHNNCQNLIHIYCV